MTGRTFRYNMSVTGCQPKRLRTRIAGGLWCVGERLAAVLDTMHGIKATRRTVSMSSRYLLPLAVAAVLAAPVIAKADVAPGEPKGDWLFRAGFSQLNPTASPGRSHVLGSVNDLTVDSDISPTATVAYMITNHIGTELLVAYPFTHGIQLKHPGGTRTTIANTDVLPPTLNIQWYFTPDKAFSPYVGVGANWTIFSGEEVRGAAGLPAGTKLKLSDSFGADAQVGADWRVTPHWFVNTDIRYVGVTTDADLQIPGSGTAKVGKVDINPMVNPLAVGNRPV
ncbi:MAG: OmpW family protein, partial [Gammaproteobacteria bacterium]|nr:OmpW family protein [Gammaproteobacteria bacterium]